MNSKTHQITNSKARGSPLFWGRYKTGFFLQLQMLASSKKVLAVLVVRTYIFSLNIYVHMNRGIFLFSPILNIHLWRLVNILPSVHTVIFEVLDVVCNFLRLQIFHKVIVREWWKRPDASQSLMCDWDKIKYLTLKTNSNLFVFLEYSAHFHQFEAWRAKDTSFTSEFPRVFSPLNLPSAFFGPI